MKTLKKKWLTFLLFQIKDVKGLGCEEIFKPENLYVRENGMIQTVLKKTDKMDIVGSDTGTLEVSLSTLD